MAPRRMLLGGLVAATGVAAALVAIEARSPGSAAAQSARGAPQKGKVGATSYAPVATTGSFEQVRRKLMADKPQVTREAARLLESRYDLADRPVKGVAMTRGKPVQGGVRVRLKGGVTWDQLAAMTPAEIRQRNLFPEGFKPLPHPKHVEGGMVFPAMHIAEVRKRDRREMARFDVEFDTPERFLPEFPPAIFLTTRPDLGDVSKGQLVTRMNFFELFDGVLNPKQLEGVRLLVTPFAQQQFNLTDDRRSDTPHEGVTCFDCHANGHTNASTHLVGDIRPQEFRRRIDTPSLRGVNQQRLFGSQRALRTVEDFTEFEQRAAYFDGDIAIAQKKGVNFLERGSEVHAMAEFQEILDFPPAPKLDPFSRLDPAKATPQELSGETIFFGKGRCSTCHPPPIYSDNFMHDLKAERFYQPAMVNGRMTTTGGPTKSFPLRGIKESPPYLHDGRLLTLDDTVEYFNLVLGLKLTAQEKKDLVAFMYTL